MSVPSIRFTQFGVGPYQLKAERLLPSQRKEITSSLSSYLFKGPPVEGPFCLKVPQDPAFKEVHRIVHYYQHMGLLPNMRVDGPTGDLQRKVAKRSVEAMRQASVPGVNGQILAGMRIADDTLSVVRNFLSALPYVGSNNPVISHLGYYAGGIWSFFAVREWHEGWKDLKRATQIGDLEGDRRAKARIVSGAIVTAGSTAYLAGKVLSTTSSSLASLGVLGAANILFGIGSFLSCGMSTLGWIRCRRFDRRLSEYLENPTLNERQKLQGALRFLKDLSSITAEEIATLRAEIEQKNPSLTFQEKEALLQKMGADLAEKKVKYLKRRISVKGLVLIHSKIDAILAKLAEEKVCPEAIKEAALLIQMIQNENRVKTSLHILSLIASLISFIAMAVAALVSGLAVFSFVLYGIAGAIYLGTEVYNTAGLFLKRGTSEGNLELHPLQDLAALNVQHI